MAPLKPAEAIGCIADLAASGLGGLVITANLDHLRRASRDARYRETLDRAEVVVADGMPLIWAAKLRGTPLPGRVAGSSMVEPLAGELARRGLGLFLIGGAPGAAKATARTLVDLHPELRIAGINEAPPGFDADESGLMSIAEEVRASEAAVVLVALGSPRQEHVAERLLELTERDRNRAVWIGVGISLSFIAGDVRRAPRWMQSLGLEWAHRLLQEPRRLFRRYLVEGLPFAAVLLCRSFLERGRP